VLQALKLIYDLETAKSQTAVLVVLFALETTQAPSSTIEKAISAKGMRLAAADAVEKALGVTPSDGELSDTWFTI
jgi:hypothetical protein